MLWLGVDVGGTFTDAVLYDDQAKRLAFAKAPSTPADPTAAVIDSIESLSVPYEEIVRFVHGTTIGTNAILQHKGAAIWMLVTKGFRDVLEIARTNRPQLYDIKSLKTPPLVARTHSIEVDERVMPDGEVRRPLDEEAVAQRIRGLPIGKEDAIIVCFLHSYSYPEHENRVATIARREWPGVYVCTSSEVLTQIREYERFNTAALNAYIGPLMDRYLDNMQRRMAARSYRGDVFIMTSNGGASTAARARRLPVSTVLSGPAGGVAAALHLGARTQMPNLITCDMGGTSTDVCLIEKLQQPVTNEQFIAGYANRTPQIEINAVGAGGGSLAWLDAGDILMVGPQSAGAEPGPACYGRGGAEPTVTDANLVLNRLGPDTALAGRLKLDREKAAASFKPLMKKLRLSELELADGIVRIAVARMVSAIKQISISNGHDPRDFVLCAYGGAGPMHAAFIAEELEIERILVPLGPGNFAALGSIMADIRQDYAVARAVQPASTSFDAIEEIYRSIEETGRANLLREGVSEEAIEMRRSVGMRYVGQSWELEVEMPPSIRTTADLDAAFYDVHQRRFGHKTASPTEIVNFKLAAIGRVPKPELPAWPVRGELASAQLGLRDVYFDGKMARVPVYQRERLPVDSEIVGPAVVEENGSTTILPGGWRAKTLAFGELFLERR